MRTVYPVGTTLYTPTQCWNGYTLVWNGSRVTLIDMNGRTVNVWQFESVPIQEGADKESHAGADRARLLDNGHLLVQFGGMMSETGAIREYDWEHNLVWEYYPEEKLPHTNLLGPHHDVFRKANGNTLLICREVVPEEYMSQVHDPRFQQHTIYGDTILEVNPAGEVVWTWQSHEHLDLNHYRIIASNAFHAGPYNGTICDWTHINTVRALPENKWNEAGDTRFKPGNVIVSPRNLDTVYIIKYDTGEIVWEYSGDYFGGLSGQHEPYMIEKGLPGAGNILIFDNGASPWKDLGHAGKSYVLEINPVTKELVWVYDAGEELRSTYTSSAQRLKNGNTLICESAAKRIFEVSPEGDIVWEHIEGTQRAYRYAYDHCPQTKTLGEPKEVAVTPPAAFQITPDELLESNLEE